MLPSDGISCKGCTFLPHALTLPYKKASPVLSPDSVCRWRLSAVRKEHAQKGLSPPNEETARRQYLGQNVTAPDLVTVKDFLRFYIATSKPQLDKEAKRPTADSINIAAEWFFAGFTRVTGTDTDKEERSEVYNVSLTLLSVIGVLRGRLADAFRSGFGRP